MIISIIIGVSIKSEYNTFLIRTVSFILVGVLFIIVYQYDRIGIVEFIPTQGSRIIITEYEQSQNENIHITKHIFKGKKGLVKDVYYDGSFILDIGHAVLYAKNKYEFIYDTGTGCFCPACGNETQTVPKNPFTLDTLQSEKCKKCKTELVSARDENGNFVWENYKYYTQQAHDVI